MLAAPDRVAVPLPLSTKVTPVGSVPVLLSAAAGEPLVVILKVPALPVVRVAVAALVTAGACCTTSEKLWVAVPAAFLATILSAYVLAVPVGVPASVPVPSPLSTKLTPAGGVPVRVRAGVGKPAVVTVKVMGWPTMAVVDAALTSEGTWFTTSKKLW